MPTIPKPATTPPTHEPLQFPQVPVQTLPAAGKNEGINPEKAAKKPYSQLLSLFPICATHFLPVANCLNRAIVDTLRTNNTVMYRIGGFSVFHINCFHRT